MLLIVIIVFGINLHISYRHHRLSFLLVICSCSLISLLTAFVSARIYILIRNCLCVYFMHQLVIHFIDVCSIVTIVRCRFTPAVELWIFGCLHLDRILCMFSLTFVAFPLSFLVLLFVSLTLLFLLSVFLSFLYFMC